MPAAVNSSVANDPALAMRSLPFPISATDPSVPPVVFVPAFVTKQLTGVELNFVTQSLSVYGPNPSTWPAYPFAQAYLRRGTDPAILRYCRTVLDQELVIEQFKMKEKIQASDPYDLSFGVSTELEACQQRLDRLEGEKQTFTKWQSESAWTLPNEYEAHHYDLLTLFPNVNSLRQKELDKKCIGYDDSSPDPSKSDFCAWVSRIQPALNTCVMEHANYLLISKVPAVYTDKLITDLNVSIPKYPTRALTRKLGALVYQQQMKDTLALAGALKLGQQGCTTIEQLFTRVLELHFCRPDPPALDIFLLDMVCGISAKLAKRSRNRFYDRVFERYPCFTGVLDPALARLTTTSTRFRRAPESSGLPSTPPAIDDFANTLILFALSPDFAKLEDNRAKLFADPLDREFGVLNATYQQALKKKGSADTVTSLRAAQAAGILAEFEGPPTTSGVSAFATATGITPAQVSATELVHAPVRSTKGKGKNKNNRSAKVVDSQTSVPPAFASVNGKAAKPARHCNHCDSNTHDSDNCWRKFPEKKKQALKDWDKKRLDKKKVEVTGEVVTQSAVDVKAEPTNEKDFSRLGPSEGRAQ